LGGRAACACPMTFASGYRRKATNQIRHWEKACASTSKGLPIAKTDRQGGACQAEELEHSSQRPMMRRRQRVRLSLTRRVAGIYPAAAHVGLCR
jgi:hypothetical protein